MHTAHSSTLLPGLFRNKSTKVHVLEPRAILLEFHGTISERHWEDKVIFPYVKQAVDQFLKTNWYNETVQQCFFGLRNESFEQRFRNKFEDAPIISDVTKDGNEMETEELVSQVSDFLVWQMNNKKETKDTQIIERLIWRDGLKRQQIKVPIYDDVMPCIRNWRTISKCQVYVISPIEEETLKLLFENTDKGNLSQLIDGYLCLKKINDKFTGDVYKHLYDELMKSRHSDKQGTDIETEHKKDVRGSISKQSVKSGPSTQNKPRSSLKDCVGSDLDRKKSTSSEILSQPKPILFVTNSGQEAKAASQVADGHAYECLLINRPGNRKIRTYYLSHFSYIERFSDIQFVQS